ncbi:hypothetical protein ACFOG5_24705 [Pedobacter fastidiosus]
MKTLYRNADIAYRRMMASDKVTVVWSMYTTGKNSQQSVNLNDYILQ